MKNRVTNAVMEDHKVRVRLSSETCISICCCLCAFTDIYLHVALGGVRERARVSKKKSSEDGTS